VPTPRATRIAQFCCSAKSDAIWDFGGFEARGQMAEVAQLESRQFVSGLITMWFKG
jgi:hypothetical protein